MKSGTPTEFRAGHEETMRDTKREKNEAQPQLRPKGDQWQGQRTEDRPEEWSGSLQCFFCFALLFKQTANKEKQKRVR